MAINNALRNQVDEELADVRRQALKKQKIRRAVKSVIQITLPAIIVFIVLNMIIGIAPVYGESMEPTLHANDWIVYNRLNQSPKRGDIYVARKSSGDRLIIKRVIGLPGETIDIKNGSIYINGTLYEETDYQTEGETATHDVVFPVTLADNEYLVLGDNREISLDSRSSSTGMIQQDHLLGKVMFLTRIFK